MIEKLLTSAQLADLLGLHVTTIRRLARHGKLPCVFIGHARRYNAAAVLASLQAGSAV